MKYPNFKFEVTATLPGTRARCGLLHTPHGTIETPNFIFCATKAALKGLTPLQAKEAGATILLANTYHLLIQPGPDIVAHLGGLHQMLHWKGPLLTDSGGFQIFSLGHGGVANEIKGKRRPPSHHRSLLKIEEEGAIFRSHLDGAIHKLTPELSIQVQQKLGADLIVTLDECTPFHASRQETLLSTERSHRWEKRSLQTFKQNHTGSQALYGIVQGGIFPDLRENSATFVAEQPFFGQAIGGTLGGSKSQMQDIVEYTCQYLPPQRPTHLLGIGGISDLWHGVLQGIDTFDCVHPTRLARHGGALTVPSKNENKEQMNLKKSIHRTSTIPIDEECTCYCCRHFTRGYLHHLFKAKESLGGTLLSIHNVHFMVQLTKLIRDSIRGNTFGEEHKRYLYSSFLLPG